MPADAVDELLDALQGPDAQADDSAPAPADDQPAKNPVRDLRKFADTVLKEKKAADSKVQKLEEELARYRASEEASVFASLGLDEKKQKLFKSVNPEAAVTREAVEGFLNDYGLNAGDVEDTSMETPAPTADTPAAPFAPVHTPGNAPETTSYTSDQLINMIMSGQTEQAHAIVTRAARQPNLITFKHADKMPQ